MASKITYQLQYYDTLLIFLNFFWFDCVQYLRTRTYCVCTFSYFSLFSTVVSGCIPYLHHGSDPGIRWKTSLSQIPVFPIAEWWYTGPYAWSTALAVWHKLTNPVKFQVSGPVEAAQVTWQDELWHKRAHHILSGAPFTKHLTILVK